MISLQAVSPRAAGYLTVHASDTPRPSTSNLNFSSNTTSSTLAVSELGDYGRMKIFNGSYSDVRVIVDIAGYHRTTQAAPLKWSTTDTGWQPKTSKLVALSCPTTTFCMAVNETGAIKFDGTTWTPSPIAGATQLRTITCVSESFCIAAGFPGVFTFDGSSWAAVTLPAGTGARSASCATETFCMLLSGSKALTFNGTKWTFSSQGYALYYHDISCGSTAVCALSGTFYLGQTDGRYVPAGDSRGAGVNVSCASPSFCLSAMPGRFRVFDGYQWSEPRATTTADWYQIFDCVSSVECYGVGKRGKAGIFDGNKWTLGSTGFESDLIDISCPETNRCWAIDQSNVFTLDGTTWSSPTVLSPVNTATSTSCPSSTFCMTVGGGEAIIFNGTSWEPATTIDPTLNLTSVSCSSESFCVAVGRRGAVVTFDGTNWSAAEKLATEVDLTSVSCPTENFCAAVGNGYIAEFDGATWGIATLSGPVAAVQYRSVSCPTTNFCLAVAEAGAASFDGQTWALATPSDSSYIGGRSVSCTSPDQCFLASWYGQIWEWNSGNWAEYDPWLENFGNATNALSCPTTSFCLATGKAALAYNGDVWFRYSDPIPGLLYVTCPTEDYCIGPSNNGQFSIGRR